MYRSLAAVTVVAVLATVGAIIVSSEVSVQHNPLACPTCGCIPDYDDGDLFIDDIAIGVIGVCSVDDPTHRWPIFRIGWQDDVEKATGVRPVVNGTVGVCPKMIELQRELP